MNSSDSMYWDTRFRGKWDFISAVHLKEPKTKVITNLIKSKNCLGLQTYSVCLGIETRFCERDWFLLSKSQAVRLWECPPGRPSRKGLQIFLIFIVILFCFFPIIWNKLCSENLPSYTCFVSGHTWPPSPPPFVAAFFCRNGTHSHFVAMNKVIYTLIWAPLLELLIIPRKWHHDMHAAALKSTNLRQSFLRFQMLVEPESIDGNILTEWQHFLNM